MTRYAIIDSNQNVVVNVVDYDTVPGNPPPGFASNFIAVQSDTGQIGDSWNGTAIVPAPQPTPPPLTPAQQVAALLAAGVAIASASDAALNGTYACSGQDWQDMRDEAQYIQTFGAFSGGLSALSWTKPDSTVTSFSTTAQFLSVVRCIGDFLTGVKQFTAGQISALPKQPIDIP